MQRHLDAPIKPLLEAHPTLVQVLDEAGIGCGQCSLGTCKVSDILEIHDLDTEASRALFTRMGQAIHGAAPFDIPEITRTPQPAKSEFCPPLARMVEEHRHILKLIGLLPALVAALRRDWDGALPHLEGALGFIRSYADHYHHAKEENILFGYFEAKAELLGVMRDDHAQGRAHVRAVMAAVEGRDLAAVEAHLMAYGELLKGHIHREDTILYPWMDRSLDMRQVGELFGRCAAVEGEFGPLPARQEAFVADLALKLA